MVLSVLSLGASSAQPPHMPLSHMDLDIGLANYMSRIKCACVLHDMQSTITKSKWQMQQLVADCNSLNGA